MEGKLLSTNGATCDVEIGGGGREPLRVKARSNADATVGGPIFINIRPEDLSLHVTKPEGESANNLISGKVIDTVYLGNFLDCQVDVLGNEISIQIDHFEQLVPGQTVYLTVAPDHVQCLVD